MKINADRALVIHPVFKSRVSTKSLNLGSFEESIALSKSLGLNVISKQKIKLSSIFDRSEIGEKLSFDFLNFP